MTPRLIVAWRMLGAERERLEDERRFAIIRAAVNADQKQAGKFLDALRGD